MIEPSPAELDRIARTLKDGGVVLLPTDTIYGLHAVATNAEAVGRIAELKGRDDTKPFVVLGASIAQLEALGVRMTHRRALEELWPAPLTVIFSLEAPIPASRGAGTLAVRIPALPWLRSLVNETGALVSTSANRSGQPPATRPQELPRDLQDRLDAILDAGPLAGEPSAILDFTGDEPRFIREGEVLFTQKVWKTLRKSL